jgi:hypothetical protein
VVRSQQNLEKKSGKEITNAFERSIRVSLVVIEETSKEKEGLKERKMFQKLEMRESLLHIVAESLANTGSSTESRKYTE